jgi:hypothetical protein
LNQPILNGAGRVLAPNSDEKAEVVILEGTEVVKEGALNAGMRFLADGKAKSMVVVLHHPQKGKQGFALQEWYPQLVLKELEHLGLEKEKVQIISVPVDGHPITLAEARFVAERLFQQGVRRAILLSEGFHTRRSFAVYSQEGARVGLMWSHIRILSIMKVARGGMMPKELVILLMKTLSSLTI